MSRSISVPFFLIAAAAVAIAPAQAQVIDGPLYAAGTDPVTVQLLGASQPFQANIFWSTGPGRFDFQQSTAIGTTPGSILATPALAGGTGLILGTLVTPGFSGPDVGSALLTTGNPDGKAFFPQGVPSPFEFIGADAAVFYGPNNTALVGFPGTADGSLTGPFSSFAIRFSVSNVIGSLGGGSCRS
jgi:hypothetical protein